MNSNPACSFVFYCATPLTFEHDKLSGLGYTFQKLLFPFLISSRSIIRCPMKDIHLTEFYPLNYTCKFEPSTRKLKKHGHRDWIRRKMSKNNVSSAKQGLDARTTRGVHFHLYLHNLSNIQKYFIYWNCRCSSNSAVSSRNSTTSEFW